MSVFIDGLEMPKTNMMLLVEPDGKVWEMGDLLGNDKLLDGVKAIPAPPHGRLIDADALRAKQQEDADLFQGSTAYCDKCRRDEAMNAVANIVNAPTILEADEGE